MTDASQSAASSGPLVLLDGSALAYRAFHAMLRSALSAPDGRPVAAVFGVCMEIQRLLKSVKPGWAALVFDTPHPTFRHVRYPAYKAQRKPMPEDLVDQLPRIKQGAGVMGFPLVELPGFEADDIIGTLARQASERGVETIIITPDKDMLQLVREGVRVWKPAKQGEDPVVLDSAGVENFFGVRPEQVIDVLALMGDTSDNIPGVPGIGPKHAVNLIRAAGSLQAMLTDPALIGNPRQRKLLEEHADSARLSRELATIETAVPLPLSLEDLRWKVDARAAATFFAGVGFRGLSAEYASQVEAPPASADTTQQWTIVHTVQELDALIARLAAAPLFSVDTETTGLNTRKVQIVGLSFSDEPGHAWYVPLNLDPPILPDAPGQRMGSAVLERLRALLEDPAPHKCGQNAKYDLLVLRHHGITLRGLRLDTMVASYLVEPEQRERNLDALTLRHFGHIKIKTETLIGSGENSLLTMAQAPIDDVGRYACEDADYTLRLGRKFLAELNDLGLMDLHDRLELPMVGVLADMEDLGIRVDSSVLSALKVQLSREVSGLEARIHEVAGSVFNISSPRQLGVVLFEQLRLQDAAKIRPRKTSTGWATGQEVLESLEEVHALPRLVLEYRSVTKLLSTYVDSLPTLVQEDHRIHTSYNQTVAITGRLSSSDPNLQNIPIRSETGRRIREAFLPTDPDGWLISADYSQVELRILAHMSGDEVLAAAFRSGADIHRDTAARVFGVEAAQVDATLRSRAKAINFGILYGMGPQRLARETGLSKLEAKDFIARYFAVFPSVKHFLEGLKQSAREKGFAETLLGRRRPVPEINSSEGMLRAFAENVAVNTPIQGTAADILKLAMIRVHEALPREGLRSRMLLTVHDELVLDAPAAEADAASALVAREMSGAFPLSVPLLVEVGRGRNWAAAH